MATHSFIALLRTGGLQAVLGRAHGSPEGSENSCGIVTQDLCGAQVEVRAARLVWRPTPSQLQQWALSWKQCAQCCTAFGPDSVPLSLPLVELGPTL